MYAEIPAALWQACVIRFDFKCRSVVGCFCVRKKAAGSLRLVIDCRRTNVIFRPPPWMPLGSLEALCRGWIRRCHEGFIAQEDIRDDFYRMKLQE